MRQLISFLIIVTLLISIVSCNKENEEIKPITFSDPVHSVPGITQIAPSGDISMSSELWSNRTDGIVQSRGDISLIGTYRFESRDEFENFWSGEGYPISETDGRVFTSDYGAGMAIEVNNAEHGDSLKWEFINPNDSVQIVSTVTYDSISGCWSSIWCGDPDFPPLDDILWLHIILVKEEHILGNWTINFYENNVLHFTQQFELLPRPKLEVVDAKMVTPGELGIGVKVTYPDYNQETVRKIRVEALINGCPVDKTIDVTQYTMPGVEWGSAGTQNNMFDINGNLAPTTPLKINLENPDDTENVVSRFSKNESFILSVEAVCEFLVDEPIKSRKSLFNVKIPLPVVVLHGYIHPVGYPLAWWQLGSLGAWEAAYKSIQNF